MRGLVRRNDIKASLSLLLVGPEKKKDSARTSSASDAPGSEQQDTSTTEGKTEEEYIHAVTYQTAGVFSFAKGSPFKPALAGVLCTQMQLQESCCSFFGRGGVFQ